MHMYVHACMLACTHSSHLACTRRHEQVCGTLGSKAESQTVRCNGKSGSVISVVGAAGKALTLCEVKV